METIKVSSKSEPNKVAGALANVFRESGKNLVCTPAFIDINIDGEERTAIKLIVEAK